MNRVIKYGGIFTLGVIVGGGIALYFSNSIKKILPSLETIKGMLGGNKIIEITGQGGKDNGMIVTGQELPEKIEDNKFPLTLIVKPNQKLFDKFNGGDKITSSHYLGNDLVFTGVADRDKNEEHHVPYDQIKNSVLVYIKN
jgi:hypothetical protein